MAPGLIGIVGIGLLGSAVADRLSASGCEVVGYDVEPERRRGANSVREVMRRASIVLLVLPNSDIAGQVLADAEPLRAALTILDLTTGDPDAMQATGERFAARGIAYIDATVGGSSEQTRRGEAIVMAGGSAESVERCRPVMAAFARQVFHVGLCGSGARMKLAMNLVLGLNRAALAEGLAFAAAEGLSMEAALEIFRAGPAWSRAMDVKGRRMIERSFQPEARLAQHRKDVDLILAAAARTGARTPLSALHRELLIELERAGFGGDDNSAIIRAFKPE
jgi:3-hydroxyisobutyrate dehydrogenase-like beta-hydroxyacid dehydrogenase